MGYAKLVVVGGGFGGLNAVRSLKKSKTEIVLLDKTNHHLFQPLLYQVATAAVSPGNISSPIREVLEGQDNTMVLLARVVKVDKDAKIVIAENGDKYPYDYLILAPGASHSYFGHPEWEALAPGLKTLDDALKIRERVILSYERAERCDSRAEATRFLRFVIVGAGPTGVEMAGAIAEMAHMSLRHNFRRINPDHTEIWLIEGTDQVLPAFPKELGEKARRDLEKMGVRVVLKSIVTNVTSEGVFIGNQFIDTPNVIWAAGNEASPLLKTLGVPLDRQGRVLVKPDLTIPGNPEIFVLGDAALIKDDQGNPLPGVAPAAIQQGRYVAKIIDKQIAPEKRKPFVYRDKGMLATIGKGKAVGVVGKWKISGVLAWEIWCFVHIAYLITFANRVIVMLQWFYLYITNQRRIRLITRPVTDFDDPLHTGENK